MSATQGQSETVRASATLRICGDRLDFDQITRSLGLTPSSTVCKGEVFASGDEVTSEDRWIFHTPRAKALDDCITLLADMLLPHAEAIRNIRRNYRVEVICSVLLRHKVAGMGLRPQSLRFFVELDLPLFVILVP